MVYGTGRWAHFNVKLHFLAKSTENYFCRNIEIFFFTIFLPSLPSFLQCYWPQWFSVCHLKQTFSLPYGNLWLMRGGVIGGLFPVFHHKDMSFPVFRRLFFQFSVTPKWHFPVSGQIFSYFSGFPELFYCFSGFPPKVLPPLCKGSPNVFVFSFPWSLTFLLHAPGSLAFYTYAPAPAP